ncbi:hypothetical protein [Novipirellula caenicola]|uniref:Bro-N domain-containing protein n=1 Tax=Novipirellula caenicola TaxID=1536901 RepID=A0ABP9VTY7_9BACT
MPADNEFAMDVAVNLPRTDHAASTGYHLLLQAYRYALNVQDELWDFALEIDLICSSGLTINDLRWLVAKDFLAHGIETSVRGDPHRRFQLSEGYNFAPTTCVMLTERGAAFVERFLNECSSSTKADRDHWFAASFEEAFAVHENRSESGRDRLPSKSVLCNVKPCWDAAARELRLASTVVKRFRVPARNQETILCVFEEEGWPECIDDPLPIHRSIAPQTRLHDAINRLNRHQANPLLSFHGNGKGTGIAWKSQISFPPPNDSASSSGRTVYSGPRERI